jgi:hypothetical protein
LQNNNLQCISEDKKLMLFRSDRISCKFAVVFAFASSINRSREYSIGIARASV